MSHATERKSFPLSMRIPEADIALIDRAASLKGRSRTDFMRDAALRAAEEVLMEQRPLRMSAGGFASFIEELTRPAAPVADMVTLLERVAPWEASPRETDDLAPKR